MDEGLEEFGEYTLRDRGAVDIVDVGQFANELRKLDPAEAGRRLKALHGKGELYSKVANAILGQLDDMPLEWWGDCIAASPHVEY